MSGRTSRPRQLVVVTPEEELENLRNEVGVLRRAVGSKSAAVGILRGELQECQRERDKFRAMAEQGGTTLHRPHPVAHKASYGDPGRSAMLSGSEGTLAQLLSQAKEESRSLRQEATELRCKLHDAQADIKVLREEVQRWRGLDGRRASTTTTTTMAHLAHQEREQFISQMEQLSVKCGALEGDVRGLVEEREELVRELDGAHHKLHRLNHVLTTLLDARQPHSPTTQPRRVVDLDAIITENRYLQQRLKQVEEEKLLAKSNATKYKAALEKCRSSQGSLKLGGGADSLIVTPKQVSELLQEYGGEVGEAGENDLRCLCVALVDALHQRSRALRTHRSANKVLVGRVAELERRLAALGRGDGGGEEVAGTGEVQLGSLWLMEGYVAPAGRLPHYTADCALADPRLPAALGQAPPSHQDQAVVSPSHSSKESGQDAAPCSTEPAVPPTSTADTQHTARESRSCSGAADQTDDAATTACREDHGPPDGAGEPSTGPAATLATDRVEQQRREAITAPAPCKQQLQAKSPWMNPEDELEDIVPLHQLDSYMRQIKQQRHQAGHTSTNSEEHKTPPQQTDGTLKEGQENGTIVAQEGKEITKEEDEDNSSFELNISDYDSDNDNLDAALEEWQQDFGQGGLKTSKSSPGKEGRSRAQGGFSLWGRIDSKGGQEVELPPALKELLDQAGGTVAALDSHVDCT